MKKTLKICIAVLGVTLFCSVQAKPSASSPIYITKINPSVVRPHGDGAIFLDQLALGTTYTVTCDIANSNYSKQYPVIIKMSHSLGVDPNVRFIVNDNEPKYRQALLDQAINKYVAIGVKRTWPQDGTLFYIKNYDDSDTVYISNCIAVEMA